MRWAADPWRATLLLVGALTAVRVATLFATHLELYPDEAQYWLWSRRLAWGYFSKPPMIAWLIRATTAAGGDGEAWVRLCAPLMHAVGALALQRAATRFFDGLTGFLAAAVYILMPGVQFSSQVVATDAPLLAFLSLSLWALAEMWTARAADGRWWALGFGAALGLACLSKYAGLYYAGGLAAHALLDAEGRRRVWTGSRLAAALAAFAVVVTPNVAWNLANHLQTLSHTVADASLGDAAPARGLDPRGPLGFVLGQFAVFGPLPFTVLLAGSAMAVWRRRANGAERLLLALTAPALLVVLAEAVAVRANANWAAAAYVSGSALAAAWLRRGLRGRAFGTVVLGGLGLQAAAIGVFVAVTVSPAASEALHLDNGLKRARGWRMSAQAVRAYVARAQSAGAVSALAVDDRFMFNALAYYGRDWIGAAGSPPLRMWVHEARPHNQAEAEAPLQVERGERVAFVSTTYPQESRWDFGRTADGRVVIIPLDRRRVRPILLYVGHGFSPRPRDRVTGLPIAP